jgi:REP element-mobilizing transposase RayT/DNA-binding NarL/FixJ family response regulator
MPAALLVATPHAAFGELIRVSLEDTGQYQVRLVMSGKEAQDVASRSHFQLAILDSALTEMPFVPLCKSILELQKGVRLIVIPPDNDVNHPSLGDLLPHGYLSRPFYLPDMINTVSQLLDERDVELRTATPSSVTIPPWVQDTITLQMYLDQEMKSTQALAGLIGIYRPNLDNCSLRVWTGQLTAESAAELITIIFRYWNKDENTDIMRFIRLAEEKRDFLIYATKMMGDFILVLAYDSKAPLSQIRPQTKNIAQVLSTIPPQKPDKPKENKVTSLLAAPQAEQSKQNEWVSEVLPNPAQSELEESEGKFRATNEESDSIPKSIPTLSTEEFDEEDLADVPNLTALLGSFPPPDPYSPPTPKREVDNNVFTVPEKPLTEWHNWQEAPLPITELPVADSSTLNLDTRTTDETSEIAEVENYFLAEPPVNALEDTRPHVVTALTSIGQLEPVSAALSQLNYTCVLVPRLPQHYLTGELADRLAQWIHQLCLAYGWRLEGIAIRPEYLQWTVQVAPSISPGNLVRIIRQRSSLNIFNQYAILREQNPSGDFWASGYLIVSGIQPPSAQLLREYIIQTRKRQGVIK